MAQKSIQTFKTPKIIPFLCQLNTEQRIARECLFLKNHKIVRRIK